MEYKSAQDLIDEAKQQIEQVTPTEVRDMQARGDTVVYLDVREPNEWNLGHLPNAVHLPRGNLESKVEGLVDRDQRVARGADVDEAVGRRGAGDEADGLREGRIDVGRHSGLGGHRRRDRRMTVAGDPGVESFEVPCRDGLTIRGEAYPASPARGSVIICHGFKGFAHWAFFPHLARTLAKSGLTAITFDFSGSGIGPDRESFSEGEAFAHNTFTRELEDIELVEEYARRMGWISGKFGLFGHSRGGGMAILYTAPEGSNVNSLVTWAAISYPNRW